jgi:hypothetical protein
MATVLHLIKGGTVKGISIILGLAFLIGLVIPVSADVIVHHKSTANMAGMMSMEMSGIDNTKGDKNYSDVTTTMTGGMMAMLGQGKPRQGITITRIDKALTWDLNPEKKTYTEKTFESIKKDFNDLNKDAKSEKNDDEYVWTIDVKTPSGSQNINGFNCKNVIGTATGIKKKDKSDTLFITYDVWVTDNVPGSAEVDAFHKNYAKAIGADEMWAKEGMASMMKDYGSKFGELAFKVGEAGGYPIKTSMLVEASARPGAEGKESGGQSMNDAMSKMSKLFGKKNAEEPQKKEVSKSGRNASFSFTNEVLSIEQKSVADGQFDIPTGYKKK